MFDVKDEFIDGLIIGNYSERIVRNYSIIDVEYIKMDIEINMMYVYGMLMMLDYDVV